jgi:hypothetical protein
VYVVPAAADLAGEWAVLERDPATRRVFAVPADARDVVGSRDLQVWEASSRLPLSLRCGLGRWLPERAFDPELRSGMVDGEGLERARAAAGTPARDGAEHTAGGAEHTAGGGVEGRTAASRPWRLAAAAALVLTAGGGWIGWRLADRGRPDGGGTAAAEAAVNVATARLLRLRGTQRITMSAGAGALLLLIDPPIGALDAVYRVELRSGDPERTVWAGEGLRRVGDAELLSVSLPASLVPPGDHRIVLSMPEDRGGPPLAEYPLTVDRRP